MIKDDLVCDVSPACHFGHFTSLALILLIFLNFGFWKTHNIFGQLSLFDYLVVIHDKSTDETKLDQTLFLRGVNSW